MAKTNLAPFAQNKRTGIAIATTAKTIYNDTANTVLVVTAGPEGAILRRITAIARATVTATQLQYYRSLDGGVTMTFFGTAIMPAATLSATTIFPEVLKYELASGFLDTPIALAANERIYCAIGVALAAGIVFTGEWEDF